MTEILITSSVLILALLVLRRVFREKISRRAQYALWLLVLARLLIPVSLPTAGFGVLSAAEPAVEAGCSRLGSRAVYVLPLDPPPAAGPPGARRPRAWGVFPPFLTQKAAPWPGRPVPGGAPESGMRADGIRPYESIS